MTHRPRLSRALVAAALALGGAWATVTPGQAHKAVTSKYRYNEDLFPLFRAHCGRCHVEGGVAPMSLMTFDDAAPWAESLRLELLSEDSVPWHIFRLTARELDMVLVWASGGAPRGDATATLPPVPLANDWAAGAPDVTIKAAPVVLAADKNESVVEHTLPLQAAVGREIVAVDLLPGNPAIVRSAKISVKHPDGTIVDAVSWRPGESKAVALKSSLRIRDGASLIATVEYKRTWKYEGQELRDTSTIGLYATKSATKPSPARPPGRPR